MYVCAYLCSAEAHVCAGACVYMSVLLNMEGGRKPQVLFLSLHSLLLLFVLSLFHF